MSAIKKGTKVVFAETGAIFTLETVTDKKVSWYVGYHKGGNGKNNLKFTTVSRNRFEGGILRGAYIIQD